VVPGVREIRERSHMPMLHQDRLLVNLVAQLAWEVEEPEDIHSILNLF
jgi:hypothetical protein